MELRAQCSSNKEPPPDRPRLSQPHRLLWPLQQTSMKRGGSNNRTCSPRGQTSEMKVQAGPCSLWRLRGRVLPASASSWGLQVLLGLWLDHPTLPLCVSLSPHMLFF